jgi:hypothetical protein
VKAPQRKQSLGRLRLAHDDAESTDAVIRTSDDPYVEKLVLLIYIMSRFYCGVALL